MQLTILNDRLLISNVQYLLPKISHVPYLGRQ